MAPRGRGKTVTACLIKLCSCPVFVAGAHAAAGKREPGRHCRHARVAGPPRLGADRRRRHPDLHPPGCVSPWLSAVGIPGSFCYLVPGLRRLLYVRGGGRVNDPGRPNRSRPSRGAFWCTSCGPTTPTTTRFSRGRPAAPWIAFSVRSEGRWGTSRILIVSSTRAVDHLEEPEMREYASVPRHWLAL